MTNRIIIGISGASGAVYGVRLLEVLRRTDIETHLIVSKSAALTIDSELDISLADVKALADQVHQVGDVAAAISSGSYRTLGMIIAPCSMRTMADIAHGNTDNLLSRAADVVLKERRQLAQRSGERPRSAGLGRL